MFFYFQDILQSIREVQSTDSQSGALSLVQISPDTLLSLVELYFAVAEFYAITTHLKAIWAFCAFQCVVMA